MHSQRRELAGISKAMPMQLATKVVESKSAIVQAQGLFAVLLRATAVSSRQSLFPNRVAPRVRPSPPAYLTARFLNSASFIGLWPTACATEVRPLGKLPS